MLCCSITRVHANVYVVTANAGCSSAQEPLEAVQFAVKTFRSGREFIDVLSTLPPGCVIIEVDDATIDEFLRLDKSGMFPRDFPTIVIMSKPAVAGAMRSVKSGVASFLKQPISTETLVSTVRKALRKIEGGDAGASLVERVSRLGGREREILAQVVAGQTNKRIAGELRISVRTVETCRAGVMRKLGLGNLTQLIFIAWSAAIRGPTLGPLCAGVVGDIESLDEQLALL